MGAGAGSPSSWCMRRGVAGCCSSAKADAAESGQARTAAAAGGSSDRPVGYGPLPTVLGGVTPSTAVALCLLAAIRRCRTRF